MESNIEITPNEISQTIANKEVSQILLKDGTILKVTQNIQGQNQNNYILLNPISQSPQDQDFYQQNNIIIGQNEQILKENGKQHIQHHRDGIGAFGQHFKTEYNDICGDCITENGVLKQRKNYVLYISKNCTEKNISRKNKFKTNATNNQNQINDMLQYQGENGEKVISQGYFECDDVPILEPKVRLRNEQNIDYRYPEYSQEQVQNINQCIENLCPECSGEELCPNCSAENLCPECREEKI